MAIASRALRVDPLEELSEAAHGVMVDAHVSSNAKFSPQFIHFTQLTASDGSVICSVEILQRTVAVLEVLVEEDGP